MSDTYQMPFWKKYTLSIEEAAVYFRIGEGKLRKLVSENPTADYLLWNGNRVQIKRVKFENFIDKLEAVQKVRIENEVMMIMQEAWSIFMHKF